MTAATGEDEARVLAAHVGITLDEEAAALAAEAMATPLAIADGHARELAFEAEPSQFLIAQQRCKR